MNIKLCIVMLNSYLVGQANSEYRRETIKNILIYTVTMGQNRK